MKERDGTPRSDHMLRKLATVNWNRLALSAVGATIVVCVMALSVLARPHAMPLAAGTGGTQQVAFHQRGVAASGMVSLVDTTESLFAVIAPSRAPSLVQVNAQTQFSGLSSGLAALRVGMSVAVEGVTRPDGSMLATQVTVSCANVSASPVHGRKGSADVGHGSHHGSSSFTAGQASSSMVATRSCGSSFGSSGPASAGDGANASGGDENKRD
jgi:hypothetical protein